MSVARLRAAIWAALEACEAGDYPEAVLILLAAVEDWPLEDAA